MLDEVSSSSAQDLSRLSGSEEYQVVGFAHEHGLSAAQVHALIKRYGNDRATLAQAARLLASPLSEHEA